MKAECNTVYCPACDKEFKSFDEYSEHAKKEFGTKQSFTICCDSNSWEFDYNGKLKCGMCGKYAKLKERFIEYIIPERYRF